jgi:Arc/MetJ family transcription regulator
MKTTIDIPDDLLADAMKFTGAKTKREAVVKAIESFNRLQKIECLIATAGTFSDLPSNDELEADDLEYEARVIKRWKAKA